MRPFCFSPALLLVVAGIGIAQHPTRSSQAQSAPLNRATTSVVTDPGALPRQLRGLEMDEHLGESLPLDMAFTDQRGREVRLGDYFDGQRPILLTLNYYRCPMLCGLTLNGLADGMRELPWDAGQEYRTLTISFDPNDRLDVAQAKRENYAEYYQRSEGAVRELHLSQDGWDFLLGTQPSIDRLLQHTGFPIRWDDRHQEWIHPAVVMVVSPDGKLTRYLYGVYFDPSTLRLSLAEASQGKVAATMDRLLLWCFHYDPAIGQYTLAAMRLARVVAGVTLAGLIMFVVQLKRRERRAQRQQLRGASVRV